MVRLAAAHLPPFPSRTTKVAFEGAVERCLKWAWAMGMVHKPKEELLTAYLRWFALNSSGCSVERTAVCLSRVYRAEMGEEATKRFKELTRALIKEANIRNPRELRAADAMPRAVLLQLVEGARALRYVMPIERTALDALVVAFATMSRTGEVLALCVEDVQEDGRAVRVVVKTSATTKVAHVKAVDDGLGLEPVGILRRRREEAVRERRPFLFPSVRKPGEAMASNEATHGLQLLSKHCGVPQRVTCHSARKGAATEAVLAGLPVPVIQAYGVWNNVGSLERYIGEALRQGFPFLSTLEAAARTESHGKRHGETRVIVSSRDYYP